MGNGDSLFPVFRSPTHVQPTRTDSGLTFGIIYYLAIDYYGVRGFCPDHKSGIDMMTFEKIV